ncbi:MAG: HAD-IA family hydrolase [Gammaproteobacteria bacterium]|jgi:phosphoglycolate phosphatase|nr:HAD-IA family hydrolase [Gammaproteobacteria bacterium]
MIACSAVLFDLDGTLLDTAPEFSYCLNTLLREEGREEIRIEGLRGVVSHGARRMLQFGFKLNEQDPYLQELLPRFLSLYQQNIGSQTQLFNGIAQVLEELLTKNIAWGIVTNKPQIYTLPLVKMFEPLTRAACVVSGDRIQKPSPAPLLQACHELDVTPKDCWYIGDAQTDVIASHRAGMRSLVANYGYIPLGENSSTWGADKYVEYPAQIPQFILA